MLDELVSMLPRADLADDPGLCFEGDGRTEGGELVFEVFVAAQDVRGAVDDGGASGDQACHDERRAAAQVGGLHDGPREPARTADERPVAAEEIYTRVEAVELFGHLEPVLVDVLRDDASACSLE